MLIPKPGTPPTPDGFRPITLLSVEYKLYTHILNEALLEWCLKTHIIPKAQNGALPDKGSDRCLWALLSVLADARQNKKPLHIMYIDFKKAFDSVEHWTIKTILKHLKLGHFGEVVADLLPNTFTFLKINDELSDQIEILCGTKQGDIISPLLFLLFMAPLLWTIDKLCKGYTNGKISAKSNAIMDDVAFISDSLQDTKLAYYLIEKFSLATGIELNSTKSAYSTYSPKPPPAGGWLRLIKVGSQFSGLFYSRYGMELRK